MQSILKCDICLGDLNIRKIVGVYVQDSMLQHSSPTHPFSQDFGEKDFYTGNLCTFISCFSWTEHVFLVAIWLFPMVHGKALAQMQPCKLQGCIVAAKHMTLLVQQLCACAAALQVVLYGSDVGKENMAAFTLLI